MPVRTATAALAQPVGQLVLMLSCYGEVHHTAGNLLSLVPDQWDPLAFKCESIRKWHGSWATYSTLCKGACGNAIEFGYLGAWNFQSEKFLRGTATNAFFADLIGNSNSFQDGDVSLTSHIQTLELNSRTPIAAGNVEFICGIRWLEWAESFSLDTQTPGPGFTNNWSSRTVNNLYGGQIGIDTLLYSTSWLHVESVLKEWCVLE